MHDLVWILFESKDPGILRRIAGYLKSRNKKDAELACRLLHFTPPRRIGPECNNRANFAAYLSWLEENGPYLYFTGEDFQYSCEPEHCRVDLEAKYLCKRISARDRRPVEPLTESERALLEEYRHEADDEKKLLSDYSRSIYRQNRSRWNRWIGYPIERKKELARKELEGNR